MRALIVDDEEDIGLMVSRFLRNEGLDVDYVNTIGSARKMIRNEDYKVYFLDLKLPDGTGFDLVSDIKKQENQPKVIVISAYDGANETRKANDIGVDAFIKKPFSKHEIINTIRNMI